MDANVVGPLSGQSNHDRRLPRIPLFLWRIIETEFDLVTTAKRRG
jgi:hypothetical protein